MGLVVRKRQRPETGALVDQQSVAYHPFEPDTSTVCQLAIKTCMSR